MGKGFGELSDRECDGGREENWEGREAGVILARF